MTDPQNNLTTPADPGPNRELNEDTSAGTSGQDNASKAPNAEARELSDKMRETRDVPVETIPAEKLPDEVVAATQEASPKTTNGRRQVEDTLNKPIEAFEDTVNQLDIETRPENVESVHGAPAHRLNNETVLFGRVIPYPVYVVVFGILAAITLVEIIIAEIFPTGFFLTTLILVALSIGKAVLVVLFYMHLREDSRIFAVALILPVVVALIATLFLMSVPTTGY